MRKLLLFSALTLATFAMAKSTNAVETVIVFFCCPETGPPLCPPDC